jgi:hypothetical protein
VQLVNTVIQQVGLKDLNCLGVALLDYHKDFMRFVDSDISTICHVSCIMYCANALVAVRRNLRPSKELDRFLKRRNLDDGLDCTTISSICKEFDLDKIDVLKYRNMP